MKRSDQFEPNKAYLNAAFCSMVNESQSDLILAPIGDNEIQLVSGDFSETFVLPESTGILCAMVNKLTKKISLAPKGNKILIIREAPEEEEE